MKKIVYLLMLAVVFSACSSTGTDNKEGEVADSSAVVENGVGADEQTDGDDGVVYSVASFNENAANLVGKEIIVEGIVDHVCRHGGKKLSLVEDGVEGSIHVVSDEVFDESLTGTRVNLIGSVTELIVDDNYCHEKMNEEQAKCFLDSMAKTGVDHFTYYSVQFRAFNELD